MSVNQTQRIDLEALNNSEHSMPVRKDALDLYAVRPDNIFADSHSGFVRKNNEDSFAYCTRPDGTLTFAMVADGIGGQSHGELASWLCARHMVMAWRKFSENPEPSLAMSENFLYTEIEKSNEEIFRFAKQYQNAIPMGTTIASVLIVHRKLITAHAGDSRVYRLRDDVLEQLTRDHSLIEKMIEQGEITEEESVNHPLAHVISKSVGPTPFADAELGTYDVLPGDRYLLCSDGLNLHVPDREIRLALMKAMVPSESVSELMSTVLRRGANDNVTMIALFV